MSTAAERLSALAVIRTVPADTAVTTPESLTVAVVTLLLDQMTERPVSTVPAESRTVATSLCVARGTMLTAADNVMLAAGTGVTEMVTRPDTDSLAAMICASPGAKAVTRPEPDTEATAGADELHVTVRSSVAPLASRGVADS
jgi:hypothetical protein